MDKMPYTVTVVLDRNFGESLSELPLGQPIWIVDTPINRSATERAWKEHTVGNHLTGVTIFNCIGDCSAEESLIDEFDTIDLHHGSYSSKLPYTVINVIGAQLTDAIKVMLSEYGFNEFHITEFGFRAVRPLRNSDNSDKS